jgi:hypothetical protein
MRRVASEQGVTIQEADRHSASTTESSHVGEDLGKAASSCGHRRRVSRVIGLPYPETTNARLRSAAGDGQSNNGHITIVELIDIISNVEV